MDAHPERELGLELRLAGDTIAGVVRDETGRRLPFAGWLGLTVVLEGVVGEMRDGPPAGRLGSGDGG